MPNVTESPSSLRELYIAECTKAGCKVNSSFVNSLPDSYQTTATLQTIDLSLNFVGQAGVAPVIAVAKQAKNVWSIDLHDNQITNDGVEMLCSMLDNHPSLVRIVLSKNPVSHVGGKRLSNFVARNPRITEINVDETLINPALSRIIMGKATSNLERASKGVTVKDDVPTGHVALAAAKQEALQEEASPLSDANAAPDQQDTPINRRASTERFIREDTAPGIGKTTYPKGSGLQLLLACSAPEEAALHVVGTGVAPAAAAVAEEEAEEDERAEELRERMEAQGY